MLNRMAIIRDNLRKDGQRKPLVLTTRDTEVINQLAQGKDPYFIARELKMEYGRVTQIQRFIKQVNPINPNANALE